MSRPRPWTALEVEQVQDCDVFTVSRLAARSPRTGRSHVFHTIDSSDWVNIVPVTAAGEIVMIQQWRHGAQSVTLEIPGGLVDPGETPAEAAARELLEETGYRAGRVESLGVANPNPAIFSNRVHTFVTRGVERVAEVRNDGTEETVVELLPAADLADAVRSGRIEHALVLAALHFYALGEQAR